MPEPIHYASAPAGDRLRRRRNIPAWVGAASLAPPAAVVVMVYYRTAWARLLHVGQASERATGTVWLAVAVASAAWVFVLSRGRKRAIGWMCLAFHLSFVALTVSPPGCIYVAWLMHWLTGPGA